MTKRSDAKAFAAIVIYTDNAGHIREQLSIAIALTPQDAARCLQETFEAYPDCARVEAVVVDPEPASAGGPVAALIASIAGEEAPERSEASNARGLTAPTVPASRTVH